MNTRIAVMHSNAFFATADQVSLSFLNLMVGGSFIYAASPEELGKYAILFSCFLLLSAAQNALLIAPWSTLAARQRGRTTPSDRMEATVTAEIVISVASLIGAAGLWLIPSLKLNPTDTLFVACGFIGQLSREVGRGFDFGEFRFARAFWRDAIYSVSSLLATAILVWKGHLTAANVFGVLGGCGVVMLFASQQLTLPSNALLQRVFRRLWPLARWSVVGASAAWFQGQAYVYITFGLLGPAAVGVVSAGRLLVAPLGLLSQSAGNVCRPTFGRMLAEGRSKEAARLFNRISLLLCAAALAYGAGLLALTRSGMVPLPSDYAEATRCSVLWVLILCVQIVRGNGSSLLQASLAFKPLAFIGLGAAGIAILLTYVGTLAFGPAGALGALLLSEIFLAVAIFARGGAEMRRASAVSALG